MGRAVVREPSVFLMDEPLSNLDAKMRVQMRSEISRIQRRVGVATLYVTHDQTEAMTMGDRVAVLHMGRLQQCDTPQILYDRPTTSSWPPSSARRHEPVRGRPQRRRHRAAGRQPVGQPHPQDPGRPAQARLLPLQDAGHGVRPEHLSDATLLASAPAPGTTLVVDVELIEALGNELQVHFLVDAVRAESQETKAATETEELVGLPIQGGGTKTTGVARVSPRSNLHAATRATLSIDTDQLHFFDPSTGSAIWA